MVSRTVLVAAVSAQLASTSLGCTIVAVGKDASSTGSPIVAHTDDSGADTTDVRFVRVPAKRWEKGSVRHLYNWVDGYPRVVAKELSPEYAPVHGQKPSESMGTIPQVPETYAYWDMDYGVQNEKGVSIGESTCTARTVGWPATADKPYGYNRAGIEDLSKIALERCATARCAVQTMGDIAVKEGFYSADSGEPSFPGYSDSAEALAVADSEELWIFDVMTGANNRSAIWAAQRVPPGNVAAVGNSFTIRQINFTDHANFLYSPDVTKLAEEKGWWIPSEGPFDFFAAYGYTPSVRNGTTPNATVAAMVDTLKQTLAFYSGRRMWRIFSLLSPAEGAKLDPNKGNLPHTKDPYPGSVPAPKGSVSPQMVMSLLRDHYEGTPYDLTQGMAAGPFGNPNRGPVPPRSLGLAGVWERAISMHRTSFSYVLEARPHGRAVSWLGLDAPHATAYLPFLGAATEEAPEMFRSHEGYMAKFSDKVAWWAFDMVAQYEDINFQLINKDVRNKSAQIEEEGHRLLAKCNEKADKAESHEKALHILTKCTHEFAVDKVKHWWEFAFSLFAKFGRYTITHNESGESGEDLQQYPAWWVASPDVGFTLWAKEGPWHGVPDVALAPTLAAAGSAMASVPVPIMLACACAMAFVGFKVGVSAERRRNKARDPFAYVAV